MSMKVCEIVSDRFIKALEQGTIPWHKPWKGGRAPINFKTKKPYRGVNVLSLALSGATTPFFLTFNQIRELGGSVKPGSESQLVIFWNWSKKQDPQTGEEKDKVCLRYYRVFNLDQTVGIEYTNVFDQLTQFQKIERCEAVIDGYTDAPILKHEGQRACYNVVEDRINMPLPKSFINEEEYYSTLFHECVHSTRHEKRLNREKGADIEAYSKEELVAEIGATMLCTLTGIDNKTFDNSAAYVQGWLKAFKNDKKMIIQAAAQAQKAVDYMCREEEAPADEIDQPAELVATA